MNFGPAVIITFITIISILMIWFIQRINGHTQQEQQRELKAVGDEAPPTAERLQQVVARLQEVNTSGNLQPDSNYKQYVDNGYITFSDGKWQLTDKGKNVVNGKPTTGKSPGNVIGIVKPSGGGNVYVPGITVFQNNAYSTGGNRFPDTKVETAKGYIITDPGNLIGRFRGCGGDGCLGALLSKDDADKIKPIVEEVRKNGGQPIGYISSTVEPGREDLGSMQKGTDYTSMYMKGWDEYGPKLTQKYKDMMLQRIDLVSKAGFKFLEIDNIDIINDSNVKEDIGVSDSQWKNFLTDLINYANSKGVSVIQKNTVEGWGSSMADKFAGCVVETSAGSGKGSYNWEQMAALLNQGKPVLVNHSGSGCSGMADKIKEWTGVDSSTASSLIISGC